MELWRNNRKDQKWELSEEEIARRFLASSMANHPWPLSRKLRAWMVAPEGLNSVWTDGAAYERIEDLILATRRHPSKS